MSTAAHIQLLAQALIAFAAFFSATTFFLTCTRFYVLGKYARSLNHWVRRFSWFLPLATALFITASAVNLAAAAKQLNGAAATAYTTNLFQVGTILYFLSTGFTKLSIYSHLSSSSFWPKQILNWIICILSLFSAVAVGLTLLPCGDIAWNSTATCDTNRNVRIVTTAWTSLNIFVDLVMLIFAGFQIRAAVETRAVRSLASGVAFVGALSTAAATWRLAIFVSQLIHGPSKDDSPAEALLLALGSTLELGLAIATGCLLTFRPLLSAFLGEPQVIYEAPTLYSRPNTARPNTATGLLQNTARSSPANFGDKMPQMYMHTRQVQVEDWVADTSYVSPREDRRKKRGGMFVDVQELERGHGWSQL